MRYRELRPSSEWSPLIDTFWAFEPGEADSFPQEHVVMPDGACMLTVAQPGPAGRFYAALTGPGTVALRVPLFKGVRYQGIRLQPGALGALLGLEVSEVVGKNLALETVAPTWCEQFQQALYPLPETLSQFSFVVERLLMPRLAHFDKLDSTVQQVVQRLIASQGEEPLGVLLESFEISERQLRRRFVAQVGITPKVFSRLRRVRRACVDLFLQGGSELVDISFDHGFADQSHFSRELRSVFGMSPLLLRQYLR